MKPILFADATVDNRELFRLAGRLAEVTVVAITADVAAANRLFGEATAAGATQRIQIWDDALEPLLQDPLHREMVLATLLAAVGRRLDSRFFLVPELTSGWLGAALAEELDAPHVSAVVDLELDEAAAPPLTADDPSPPTLIVRRRCLHGIQRLRGLAIGVLCVLPGAAGASPAGGAAQAGERWLLNNLDLRAAELPRAHLRAQLPERRTEPQSRSFTSLAALAERLRQDGLLPLAGEG